MARHPRADTHPFFDNGGRPIAFAHRGGALTGDNVGLENTMVAFAAAVALGYGYVETDVHATADGHLVAFHDATLDRLTDQRGHISSVPYADLSRLRVGGREALPLLHEILASWPELRLNIDAKSVGAIEPLARAIDAARAWDRVCVASFSPRRLHQLRVAVGPRVASSYSVVGVGAMRLLPGRRLRHSGPGRFAQAAQIPVRAGSIEIATSGFVGRAHELGKHVHVWTIDDPTEMHRLLDLGIDGIMSDRIDLLRDVYVARGAWNS